MYITVLIKQLMLLRWVIDELTVLLFVAASRRVFAHEVEALKRVHLNPHVLSLLGYLSSPSDLMLVTEFCALGGLDRLLDQHPCHYAVSAMRRF